MEVGSTMRCGEVEDGNRGDLCCQGLFWQDGTWKKVGEANKSRERDEDGGGNKQRENIKNHTKEMTQDAWGEEQGEAPLVYCSTVLK